MAIRQLGNGFGRGQLFPFDLFGAADAKSAMVYIVKKDRWMEEMLIEKTWIVRLTEILVWK